MATPYKINIPMYEGPLDLLLDLIRQQKMNVHDIQISSSMWMFPRNLFIWPRP